MLDKNEKPYLNILVRPAQIELANGAHEYLYGEHKYRHLAEALIARQKMLQLREKEFSCGITEDMVGRAETEISRLTNRTLVFSGPLLPTENAAVQDENVAHQYEERTDEFQDQEPIYGSQDEELISQDGSAAKIFGIVLISVSVLSMLYGAMMDTSVEFGFDRVYNFDLANQQRNILIVGAVGVIAGLVLMAMGQLRGNSQRTGGSQSPSVETTKKCPACAEFIKKEARLC